jgi:hypothetical protein
VPTEVPEHLTTMQVVELIGERLRPVTVSDEWVRTQVKVGRLRCLRLSPKKLLYRREDVEAFLKAMESDASAVAS